MVACAMIPGVQCVAQGCSPHTPRPTPCCAHAMGYTGGRSSRVRVFANAAAAAAVASGTPVPKNTILVVGATGTLGRQIVRRCAWQPGFLHSAVLSNMQVSQQQPDALHNCLLAAPLRVYLHRALDDGYDVRCLVRPRMNPADFLRDWGAKTVNVGARPCRHAARHAIHGAVLLGDLRGLVPWSMHANAIDRAAAATRRACGALAALCRAT